MIPLTGTDKFYLSLLGWSLAMMHVIDAVLDSFSNLFQSHRFWLSGIEVRTLWDFRPLRYGFAVIDDDVVVAGSYGFSRAEEGYESVVVLQGEVVRRYSEELGDCGLKPNEFVLLP